MADGFTPILYLKAGCPHCFKLRLFVLEAGLADRFEQREFTPGDAAEPVIRDELAAHFAKASFPTVQFAPGRYLAESDEIIARYAVEYRVDTARLPLMRTFADVILPMHRALRVENKALRERCPD